MVKVMVTVDPTMQNQTTTSFSDPAQRSFPNDEFDLGITQENPIQEQVISVSSVEPASVSETNASFDFSLDLPDSYSQVEEPAPIQTNAVATEASSVPQEELPVASSQDVIPSDESAVSSFVGESSSGGSASLDTVLKEDAPAIFSEESPQNPPLEQSLQEMSLPDSSDGSSQLLDEEGLNPDLLLQSDSVIENGNPMEKSASELSNFTFVAEPHQDMTSETLVQETIPQVESQTLEEPQDFLEQSLELQPNHAQSVESVENVASVSEEDSLADAQLVQSQQQEVPQGKVLNLDEMISQFSANDAGEGQIPSVQSSQDPFSAMKSTIEAHHQENMVDQPETVATPQVASAPVSLQESPVHVELQQQPLQDSVQSVLETSSPMPSVDGVAPTPTLDLDMLTSVPVSPLTNPTPYSQAVVASQQPTSSKKRLGVVLGVLVVVLLGAIAFMKYPDIFVLGGNKLPVQTSMLGNDDGQEHGAASLLTGDLEDMGDINLSGDEQNLLSEEEYVTVLDANTEDLQGTGDDVPTIDLNGLGTSDTIASQDHAAPSEDLSDDSALETDPLGAVESLVGPVNNNDFIKQEILDYQKKGTQLKEQGDAQGKKAMMKYGLAVEKEAQKLLDQLANGENIDISTWSDQKVKLDDYLDKATNA